MIKNQDLWLAWKWKKETLELARQVLYRAQRDVEIAAGHAEVARLAWEGEKS